jgi:PhnB protein
MKVESYLFFNGRTEEAIEFYKKALGAKVGAVMRFKDSPEQPKDSKHAVPAGWADKVMHSVFTVGETMIMASDGMGPEKPEFKGFSLAIATQSEDEAKKLFAALGEGGKVSQPLIKTFFSPAFGMVVDKFGVNWMVLVDTQKKN